MRFFQCAKIIIISLVLAACGSESLEIKGPRSAEFSTIEDAKTIVFIHGMYLTPKAWKEWELFFQAKGYRTYAPAWPYHETSVAEQNAVHPSETLGSLTLEQVITRYRDFLGTLSQPPILIGHSMGGLVAQLLLAEGLAAGAIAVNSAPPQGIVSLDPDFIKANFPHLNPFQNPAVPTQLTFEQFQFGFVNGMSEIEQKYAYEHFAVPESRRVGRAPLTTVAKMDYEQARGPLLLVAGEIDRTIPASLTLSIFESYQETPGITDYIEFVGRNHYTIKQFGWVDVTNYVATWIEENR